MTFDEFNETLSSATPPAVPPLLVALWHDARGDWEAAHRVAQDVNDRDGAWVHAYLHRKEGDLGNAGYWYRKAGQTRPEIALESEWELLLNHFLSLYP